MYGKKINTFLFFFSLFPQYQGEKAVMCFLKSWSLWKTDKGSFGVHTIPTDLCTHIVYGYIGIDERDYSVKIRDPNADNEFIEGLMKLKKKNPTLKIIVGLGGYAEGSENYSKMARSSSNRAMFVKSLKEHIRKHQYDGLFINWEYPGQRGGIPDDKYNYIEFLKEVKDCSEEIMLVVHVSGKKAYMDSSYDVKAISDLADYISLATYNYHLPSDGITGVNAPLTSDNEKNIMFSVDYILSRGADKDKLLLGLPAEGTSFIIEETVQGNDYFGLVSNQSFEGPFSRQSGSFDYAEMCWVLKTTDIWQERWDDNSQTPFSVKQKQLVSFDDARSYKHKLKFLLARDLAGVFIYSMDGDDFGAICFGERYPLITGVNEFLKNPPTVRPERLHYRLGSPESRSKVLMCYIRSWSSWHKGRGQFQANYVDPFLCTHIVYCYIGLNATTYLQKDRDPDADHYTEGKKSFGNLKHLVSLKKINPNLKVIVSVGGWADGSEEYSRMVEKKERRQLFIDSLYDYINKHELDGIDVNWEHPTQRGGKPEDKQNYVTFLKEMREKLGTTLSLSIRISGKKIDIDDGYDVAEISKYVDFMSVSAFHYTGPWNKYTGPNAPLKDDSELNVYFTVEHLLSKGAPKEKLLLGFPSFGHAYEVGYVENESYLSKDASDTIHPPWSFEKGTWGFNEICWIITREPNWKDYWDGKTSTAYSAKGKQVLIYDSVQTFKEKVKKLQEWDLGGAMVFSLDSDDFSGECYGQTYPLTSVLKKYSLNETIDYSPVSLLNSTTISQVTNVFFS